MAPHSVSSHVAGAAPAPQKQWEGGVFQFDRITRLGPRWREPISFGPSFGWL